MNRVMFARAIRFGDGTHETQIEFGGADLATLYVTSMRFGLTDAALGDQPLAGSLLQLDVGVKGKPENVFGG